MTKTRSLKIVLGWKYLAFIIIAGVCITFAFGFVENTPPYMRHVNLYGYPIEWRIVTEFGWIEYNVVNLLADFVFWIAAIFMVVALYKGISHEVGGETNKENA